MRTHTTRRLRGATASVALATATVITFGAGSSGAAPTCSTTLGITVHGQHIVSDYVAGTHDVSWPPAGQVGAAVSGDGAETPGGPGPGFHFPNGFAPGASFCLDQSNSPGSHPGLG